MLNSTKVKYLIVGGHAVAFHGRPRFTGDFDFFIERSAQNAARMAEVVSAFGFGSLGLKAEDFLEVGIVVQLGRPPNRIDLLTSIDGVEFSAAWQRKMEGKLDGIPAYFIGKEELLANKRATGRPQDLADAAELES